MTTNMRPALLSAFLLLFVSSGTCAPRQHTIVLGKWRTVEVRSDSATAQPMKVRELMVDGRLRDYVSGPLHEVTETLFVVRRASSSARMPRQTRLGSASIPDGAQMLGLGLNDARWDTHCE